MATFHAYAILYIITMDEYVCVRYFTFHIFILCIYVGLDNLFSGIDLIHISNKNMRVLIKKLYPRPAIMNSYFVTPTLVQSRRQQHRQQNH